MKPKSEQKSLNASELEYLDRPGDTPAEDIFDRALSEILSKDSPSGNAIIGAINRTLRQYRMADSIEVYEVLHEAYLRGKKKLQAGETVKNPNAWLRATSFNIIYERKRKHRDSATEPQVLESVLTDPRITLMQQQILTEELDQLHQALHLLQKEDPEGAVLLYLRTVRNLTWKQIQQCLVGQGEPNTTEVVLRNRASRAKRRLRDIFLQDVLPKKTVG